MNAPAGNSISTAEQAIAMMFALARKLPQAHGSMKQKKWEKTKFQGSQLTGKTLGVIGLGRIGKEVVKRAKGLQMKVLGFDPYIPSENLTSLEIDLVPIDTILKNADFITVHTPLTDATKGLVNEKNLSLLKPGVRLINCARGGIYDEAAIAKGVKDGIIAGAGLDVFMEEPLPATSELYDHDDIILTPHLGASTDEAQIEVAKESADLAMDAAACIGCGACVAACPNASAMLFTAAKVSHLGVLPQGQTERFERVARRKKNRRCSQSPRCPPQSRPPRMRWRSRTNEYARNSRPNCLSRSRAHRQLSSNDSSLISWSPWATAVQDKTQVGRSERAAMAASTE